MATKQWYAANKIKMRAYRKKWYVANRAKQKALVVKRRHKLAQWMLALKETMSCSCGESHIATLDFHHNAPNEKTINICDAVFQYGWSKKKIINEMNKCKILCSNCHRKLHWND